MIVPVHYRVSLEPDLANWRFAGQTDITLEASAELTDIGVDAVELTVHRCLLALDDVFTPCSFEVDTEIHRLNISLPHPMTGMITLRIDYEGTINDKMAGFYRSRYASDDTIGFIAVTQFQERDARRAFPCFDHPVYKATFDVEMTIDAGLTAISNCPVAEETTLEDGRKKVAFHRTPKMSTYLLFFGVGPFEFKKETGAVTVQVATMPGMGPYADYALKFGRDALVYCEEYYGIPYPLPKLDLLAIPDFAFGAMENWGAITFRENLLLHYPGVTSRAAEQRICEVIAHEIAHQWFGNLVTPSDWRYLWLNESFATFFGYGVVAHYHPEWDIWGQFLRDYTGPALERDSLVHTVPIELPGGDSVTINASTAPIIYNKGGSILRQVEGYIGEGDFKRGLRHYLKEHKYDCASSHHLWESLEAASEKPVTAVMKTWIEQPGYPLLEVERHGGTLMVTQKRFTYLPDPSSGEQRWLIPVSVRVFNADGSSHVLSKLTQDATLELEIGLNADGYKINNGQHGFYRVKYLDRKDWKDLTKRIRSKELSVEDRWGLQSDLFALVKAGQASLDDYLSLVSFYDNEDAYLPLADIAESLFLSFLVMRGTQRQNVASVGKVFLERVLAQIGLEPRTDEPHTTSMLRDQILWHAILYGARGAEESAMQQFRSLARGNPVHPDLLKSALQAGAHQGREQTVDWFERKLREADSEHERMNILVALGCFRDINTTLQVLDYVLDAVPNRNKFIPIVAAAANPYAAPHLWDWFVSRLDRLEQLHPVHFERVIAGIVPLSGIGIGRHKEITRFFREYATKRRAAPDVINMSLERMEIYSRMERS